MKIPRTSRLNSEFQREISSVIQRELKDKEPALSPVVSVTEADVASDLKSAKIYISIFDTNAERKNRSFDIICENAGFIRHCLAQKMRIRTIPVLSFVFDGSMEYGSKIDKLLQSVHKDYEEDEKGETEEDKE